MGRGRAGNHALSICRVVSPFFVLASVDNSSHDPPKRQTKSRFLLQHIRDFHGMLMLILLFGRREGRGEGGRRHANVNVFYVKRMTTKLLILSACRIDRPARTMDAGHDATSNECNQITDKPGNPSEDQHHHDKSAPECCCYCCCDCLTFLCRHNTHQRSFRDFHNLPPCTAHMYADAKFPR